METQTLTTPRFRTDLVTQPIEAAGQRFVDVTDPDSGTTFRFYEVEYAIACAMNGARDLRGLASWALEELGLETNSTELSTVINTLGELGYLEGEAAAGDVALGAPGGAPPVEQVAAPIEAADLALGAPGKSPIARSRPTPPASDDIALGAPGAVDAAGAAPGMTEESFEGLLDEEPPTKVRPAPARPAATSMDDEPTRRREVVDEMDFGDLEGITPPPVEVPLPKLRPITSAPMADDDGPTNLPPPAPGLEEVAALARPDVSVDLSEHLSIDAADVKEAVRQSQVMQAVDVPEELLAEIGQEAAKPEGEKAKAESSVPVVLPDERAQVSRPVATPAAEPQEAPAPVAATGGSGTLLFLIFLLIIVGAGAAYYFLVYKKKLENQASTAGTTQPARSQTPVEPTPPPPPPKPSATLEAAAAEQAEVTMPKAGAVSWMADDGAQVAKGDPVAKLKGIERYERKLAEYKSRQEHYQRKLDKANEEMAAATTPAAKARAQRHIDSATRKVEQKKQGQVDMTDEIAKLTLAAPTAGTVNQVAHVGGWMKDGATILEIGGPAGVQATFALPAGRSLSAGDAVKVAPKGAPGDAVDCQVDSVAGASATVWCAAGDKLSAGGQVELQ